MLGTCSSSDERQCFQRTPSAFATSFPVFQGEMRQGAGPVSNAYTLPGTTTLTAASLAQLGKTELDFKPGQLGKNQNQAASIKTTHK